MRIAQHCILIFAPTCAELVAHRKHSFARLRAPAEARLVHWPALAQGTRARSCAPPPARRLVPLICGALSSTLFLRAPLPLLRAAPSALPGAALACHPIRACAFARILPRRYEGAAYALIFPCLMSIFLRASICAKALDRLTLPLLVLCPHSSLLPRDVIANSIQAILVY